MSKLLDKYYKYPTTYDFIISLAIVVVIYFSEKKDYIDIPSIDFSNSFASDIGAIGLTISGFILTLVTILISFKSSQLSSEEKLKNSSNPFKIFLASNLYTNSIKIMQKGVISLIIISFSIYISKILFVNMTFNFLFYLNVVGLIIILSTFLRCYYILGLILKMQK